MLSSKVLGLRYRHFSPELIGILQSPLKGLISNDVQRTHLILLKEDAPETAEILSRLNLTSEHVQELSDQ